MDIWNRFTRRPDGKYIIFPVHLFLFVTLVFGISFVLPPDLLSLHLSEVFRFSDSVGHFVPFVLGCWMILTTILNTITVVLRNRWIGGFAAMMGFAGWVYVGFSYLAYGYWFAFLTAALPCTLFWGWYYLQMRYWIGVDKRNSNEKSGSAV